MFQQGELVRPVRAQWIRRVSSSNQVLVDARTVLEVDVYEPAFEQYLVNLIHHKLVLHAWIDKRDVRKYEREGV